MLQSLVGSGFHIPSMDRLYRQSSYASLQFVVDLLVVMYKLVIKYLAHRFTDCWEIYVWKTSAKCQRQHSFPLFSVGPWYTSLITLILLDILILYFLWPKYQSILPSHGSYNINPKDSYAINICLVMDFLECKWPCMRNVKHYQQPKNDELKSIANQGKQNQILKMFVLTVSGKERGAGGGLVAKSCPALVTS